MSKPDGKTKRMRRESKTNHVFWGAFNSVHILGDQRLPSDYSHLLSRGFLFLKWNNRDWVYPST